MDLHDGDFRTEEREDLLPLVRKAPSHYRDGSFEFFKNNKPAVS